MNCLTDLNIGCCTLRYRATRLHTAATHNLIELITTQRNWLAVNANKTSYAWGVTNNSPGIVIQLHANKNVTWENLGLFGLALAAVLDLSNFLSRNLNINNSTLKAIGLNAVLKVSLYLVLIT